MAHVIQLALGAFISSLGVTDHTKSWEAHEHNQQFGENTSIDIGKSQRLWKEGNARSHKASAMRPGLAKIIEKVHISTYFEIPDTDLNIAKNACCIDYADTWSSKWLLWLSESQSTYRGTTYYGCEGKVEFNTRIAWAGLPIARIHPPVAEESKIQWIMVTFHNTGWMDCRQVCLGSVKAILLQDAVDVEVAYGHSASRRHCI